MLFAVGNQNEPPPFIRYNKVICSRVIVKIKTLCTKTPSPHKDQPSPLECGGWCSGRAKYHHLVSNKWVALQNKPLFYNIGGHFPPKPPRHDLKVA